MEENKSKKLDNLLENNRRHEMGLHIEEDTETGNDSGKENNINSNQYCINVNTKIQHSIGKQIFLSNKICTSKYNFINVIPKILYEQFSKVGNIYFLFLAILQMVPKISQSSGSPIMLVPLIFVTLINSIKDFCEDYKRKQSDNRENKSKCEVINSQGVFQTVDWEELSPGDIVKINKDEYFPADLVLIFSKNKNGVAYVETKNLDGETNLKYKESLKNSYRLLKKFYFDNDREQILKKTFGCVMCEMPNANMYDFEGVYYYENRTSFINEKIVKSQNDLKEANKSDINIANNDEEDFNQNAFIQNNNSMVVLDYNNLLLRGSSLRNTDYVYGIVVYCGHNSKIMLNSLNARTKQSKVFRIMNSQLKLIIIIQIGVCFLFSLFYLIDPHPYGLTDDEDNSKFLDNFIFPFLTWLIAINNMLPISLLVTIEMIKFCQAILISWDAKMYDKDNRRTAMVQTSSLNEELGQIHDIFTDKTGTLTKNIMQFKYMVIGEFLYGSDKHIDFEELKEKNITNVDFNDPTLLEHWKSPNHVNSDRINNFIFSLALCHSIIVEKKNGKIEYNASSPDELALVNAAKYFGVEFIERTDDNFIKIKYNDKICSFKLLHIFEFNSVRKRMSVVIRDEKNMIKLICKGADTVIRQRIDISKSYLTEKLITHYLEEFGKKGLRTLMIAERYIGDAEYKRFYRNYYNAFLSQSNKKEKLDSLYESLEKEFILIGATAIEDCLQDDLKPTLEAFREIGIKIWMLTGDHPFTAVSIAHSCGLIEESNSVKIISSLNFSEINQKLINIIDDKSKNKICLVVTGDTLSLIQKPSGVGLMNLFLLAIKKSVCVICSRVSPRQKAELVMLVKNEFPMKTTLAIGDGANDVNMINSADVGIGIMGNEGQQAARASDYVIGQFSFLKRLMFVHGREAYRKNSFAVGYILWKNFLYVTPCIIHGIKSYFSGQTLYDPVLDTLYNILFTAYPIGWFATFDRELNYDELESTPKFYEIGMADKDFNLYIFWIWYIFAATAGAIIYLFNCFVFPFALQGENSDAIDQWTIGSSMFTCIVFVVNLRILLATNTHTIFSFLVFLFSLSSYVTILYVTNKIPTMETFSQFDMMINSKIFIFSNLLIITACILFQYASKSILHLINSYIDKFKKSTTILKKHETSITKIDIDDPNNEKGYSIKIESSINQNLSFDKLENENKNFKMSEDAGYFSFDENGDDKVVSNLRRRYTGYAYCEDVANVNLISQSIQEDFCDNKFKENSSDLGSNK